MKLDQFLQRFIQRLRDHNVSTARLDLLVLLEDCLGRDRAYLLAHPELELTAAQVQKLEMQLQKRAQHVPLAYIRGKTEFYGREFSINDQVLEPRPETETMIDVLKSLPETSQMTLVDVGTGSGAIAVTAALELPQSHVIAIDIDPDCVQLARQNAAALHAAVQCMQGDLVAPLARNQPDHYALLCNLPYVPDSYQINQAASHEPRLAIFGGPDGLDMYRRLFDQLANCKIKPKYILTEAMPPQHQELAAIAHSYGYSCQQSDDFIQLFIPSPTSDSLT